MLTVTAWSKLALIMLLALSNGLALLIDEMRGKDKASIAAVSTALVLCTKPLFFIHDMLEASMNHA